MLSALKHLLRRELAYIRSSPFTATLDLTDRCNQRCLTCRAWQRKNSNHELRADQWAEVLSQLAHLGITNINLIGAEPLLRKDLVDIITTLKAKGQKGHLFTNGTLLTDRLACELVQKGLDTISISLQGPTADDHDHLVNLPGAFQHCMQGMQALLAARHGQRNGNQPNIKIHTTLNALNIDRARDMVALANSLGVDALVLQFISQPPNEINAATSWAGKPIASNQYEPQGASLLPSDLQIDRFQRDVHRYWRQNRSIQVLISLEPHELTKGHFPLKKCYVARCSLSISPEGNVYPCGMIKNYHFGNVLGRDLAEILTSPERLRFIKQLDQGLLSVCAYCCHFYSNLTPSQLLWVSLGHRLSCDQSEGSITGLLI